MAVETKTIVKGRCLIFNYASFDDPRHNFSDATLDRDSLDKTFSTFGFTTVTKDNLTAAETLRVLDAETKSRDIGKYDCIVVCILSHGNQDGFLCRDQILSFKDKVLPKFFGDKFPIFANKPRLFFVDTCRGIKIDRGALFGARPTVLSVPITANMLVFYSCYEDHVSFSSVGYGSWFTQELCAALRELGEKEDLYGILTLVNKKVSNKVTKEGYKQMSAFMSLLTYRLKFRKPGDETKRDN